MNATNATSFFLCLINSRRRTARRETGWSGIFILSLGTQATQPLFTSEILTSSRSHSVVPEIFSSAHHATHRSFCTFNRRRRSTTHTSRYAVLWTGQLLGLSLHHVSPSSTLHPFHGDPQTPRSMPTNPFTFPPHPNPSHITVTQSRLTGTKSTAHSRSYWGYTLERTTLSWWPVQETQA